MNATEATLFDVSLPADGPVPVIAPLGDSALLVRFDTTLSDVANRAATAFAGRFMNCAPSGVLEVVPSLVSVLVRYDPARIDWGRLAGEVRLALSAPTVAPVEAADHTVVPVRFGGADGPDLDAVAAALGLDADTFVERHNSAQLRVLAVGFAPGFVYCGFHADALVVPRRDTVRPEVPMGSILFAAGQTAIAATAIPSGWHVIGRTDFRNFDAALAPPVKLVAGDLLRFTRSL